MESNFSNPLGHGRVTMKDIANKTGYSVSTVSRVLNQTRPYPEKTRKKVFEVAEKLGYKVDPMLRALAAYRQSRAPSQFMGTLAMLFVDYNSNEVSGMVKYPPLQEGLEEAERLGYKVEMHNLHRTSPRQLARQLKARGVLGIIIVPLKEPDGKLEMDLSSFSVIRLGHTLSYPELNMVSPSQYHNLRSMLGYLQNSGVKRIGMWLQQEIDERVFGTYTAAYLRYRALLPKADQVPFDTQADWSSGSFVEWLELSKPEVVIGLPHHLYPFMKSANRNRVPVYFPVHISDWNDNELHVDENWEMIYRTAFQQLDRMIRHGEKGVPENFQRIVVKGVLKEGKTDLSRTL